ncbi:MAG: alpha/beta fold hydrolase, partial [Bacteroidales bacterium]|nr:alpha/beta fold hydrolase [Bacteroidales bacterium]
MAQKINYSIAGNGPCVVLLHGLMEDLHIWDDFSKCLSEYYKVICVDLPGHGESDIFGNVHTMDFMAQCVNAVLENHQISECVMVGHSMGGYVTTAFAQMFSEKLKGICFFNSHAQAETEEGKKNRDRAAAAILKSKSELIASFIRDLFTKENREKYREEINALIDRAKNMKPEAIAAAQRGMKERESGLSTLIEIKAPVLFIAGKQDPVIAIDKVMAQAHLPDHSELLILG